ncbi:sugar ABC transporter substrate-binding protein [Spirochaetia bacterium]|nr:sugar ABC transporter substrate-binding protein [Spirochaetia bacterium]
MKNYFKVIAVLLSFLALGSLASCNKSKGSKQTGDLSSLTIGTCVMSFQQEFMIDLVTGYKEFIRQTKANVILTDGGNMEPEKQVQNVQNFIAQKVDGILVQAIAIDVMRDTINQAYAQGIPIGYYPPNPGVNANTWFDYNEYDWGYQLGEEAAEWTQKKLNGKAKVINVESNLEQAAQERARGWREAMQNILGKENVQFIILDAKTTENTMSVTESALQANPDARVVLVHSDDMCLGAYEAVVQSGLPQDNFFVGSCDGTTPVLELVEQNTVYRATVGNDRFVTEMGFYWIENIARAALGMPYDSPFPITTITLNYDNVKQYRARAPKYELSPEIVEYMKTH